MRQSYCSKVQFYFLFKFCKPFVVKFYSIRAIEIKNLERAEIKRKLEEVAKKEIVRKIRVTSNYWNLPFVIWSFISKQGHSSLGHSLPFLWSTQNNVLEAIKTKGDDQESYELSKRRYAENIERMRKLR